MTEREYFIRNVTMLYDTREKENGEILGEFAKAGLAFERATFDTADYSFRIDGVDYRDKWLGERKGCLSEIYGNVMASNVNKGAKERNNLEEELQRAKDNRVKEFVLFIEGAASWTALKRFKLPYSPVGASAGKHIYSTLVSWASNNRYGFKTVLAATRAEIASEIIARAYYFWRNEMKNIYGDKFLKVLIKGAEQKNDR